MHSLEGFYWCTHGRQPAALEREKGRKRVNGHESDTVPSLPMERIREPEKERAREAKEKDR